jgi:alpha-glucosidase
MLGLYREALRLRREHPALGDGALEWSPSPAGTLVFTREPGFVCTVNTGSEPVALPAPGTPVLASGPFELDAEAARGDQAGVLLPPDTAVWWVRAASD